MPSAACPRWAVSVFIGHDRKWQILQAIPASDGLFGPWLPTMVVVRHEVALTVHTDDSHEGEQVPPVMLWRPATQLAYAPPADGPAPLTPQNPLFRTKGNLFGGQQLLKIHFRLSSECDLGVFGQTRHKPPPPPPPRRECTLRVQRWLHFPGRRLPPPTQTSCLLFTHNVYRAVPLSARMYRSLFFRLPGMRVCARFSASMRNSSVWTPLYTNGLACSLNTRASNLKILKLSAMYDEHNSLMCS